MSEYAKLTKSIAETIDDYEFVRPVSSLPEHVNRWINQFGKDVRLPILREMDYVLKRTYFSREKVINFLSSVMQSKNIAGDDPGSFWRMVNFLDIQQGGNSQREMLSLFDELLKNNYDYGVAECGGGEIYVYIDDGIFSGNRVRGDIVKWINDDAPVKATVYIVTIMQHTGNWYAEQEIKNSASESFKAIKLNWRCQRKLENRKRYRDNADVLWPTEIPNDNAVQEYCGSMKYLHEVRRPGKIGEANLFSSDAGKVLLEQEFLKVGAKIRQQNPNLLQTIRPLGATFLDSLGFGSLAVTWRNCPNTTPLALWAGNQWYPLFWRKTNKQTKDT